MGIQPACDLPQVLASVIEIDDLNRTGKVLIGKIPDPFNIQKWLDLGGQPPSSRAAASVADLVRQHAPSREISPETTLGDLGLTD